MSSKISLISTIVEFGESLLKNENLDEAIQTTYLLMDMKKNEEDQTIQQCLDTEIDYLSYYTYVLHQRLTLKNDICEKIKLLKITDSDHERKSIQIMINSLNCELKNLLI
jgi:hypothetical protein